MVGFQQPFKHFLGEGFTVIERAKEWDLAPSPLAHPRHQLLCCRKQEVVWLNGALAGAVPNLNFVFGREPEAILPVGIVFEKLPVAIAASVAFALWQMSGRARPKSTIKRDGFKRAGGEAFEHVSAIHS